MLLRASLRTRSARDTFARARARSLKAEYERQREGVNERERETERGRIATGIARSPTDPRARPPIGNQITPMTPGRKFRQIHLIALRPIETELKRCRKNISKLYAPERPEAGACTRAVRVRGESEAIADAHERVARTRVIKSSTDRARSASAHTMCWRILAQNWSSSRSVCSACWLAGWLAVIVRNTTIDSVPVRVCAHARRLGQRN